jgi:hypothetical protein
MKFPPFISISISILNFQAFSDIDKLKPHMLKHCTGALSPTLSQWAGNSSGHHSTETDIAATAAAAVAASGADRKSQFVKETTSLKKEDDMSPMRLATFSNPASALGTTSSLLHPEAGLCDLASRSSAALHALSFMSPLSAHYSPVTSNQLNSSPPSFLSSGIHPPIYTGSGMPIYYFLNSTKSFWIILLNEIFFCVGLLLNHSMGTSGVFGKPNSPGKIGSAIQGNNKRPSSSPVDHLMLSPEAKKMRFQSSMRLLKDEPVPDGYVRFR